MLKSHGTPVWHFIGPNFLDFIDALQKLPLTDAMLSFLCGDSNENCLFSINEVTWLSTCFKNFYLHATVQAASSESNATLIYQIVEEQTLFIMFWTAGLVKYAHL